MVGTRTDDLDGRDLDKMTGRRVLVLGEVILDRYLHGEVSRISPEAPVPVVHLQRREIRLGGAANVAMNLAALGTNPAVFSVVGDDAAGREIGRLLESHGISAEGLETEPSRTTTVKTRVLARHQQVVRLDDEQTSAVSEQIVSTLFSRLVRALEGAEALIISDYAKGMLSETLVQDSIRAAESAGVPVLVDPKRRSFAVYRGATLITPNLGEAGVAVGRDLGDEHAVIEAARSLRSALDLEAVLITRGEEGMVLVRRGAEPLSVHAHAREVFDVTGAGDTVVATLAACRAAGIDWESGALWATRAAAIAVGRLGTATVTREELRGVGNGGDSG